MEAGARCPRWEQLHTPLDPLPDSCSIQGNYTVHFLGVNSVFRWPPSEKSCLRGRVECAGGDLGLPMGTNSLVSCCPTCNCHHSLGKEPGCVSSLSSSGSCRVVIGETPAEKLHCEI